MIAKYAEDRVDKLTDLQFRTGLVLLLNQGSIKHQFEV